MDQPAVLAQADDRRRGGRDVDPQRRVAVGGQLTDLREEGVEHADRDELAAETRLSAVDRQLEATLGPESMQEAVDRVGGEEDRNVVVAGHGREGPGALDEELVRGPDLGVGRLAHDRQGQAHARRAVAVCGGQAELGVDLSAAGLADRDRLVDPDQAAAHEGQDLARNHVGQHVLKLLADRALQQAEDRVGQEAARVDVEVVEADVDAADRQAERVLGVVGRGHVGQDVQPVGPQVNAGRDPQDLHLGLDVEVPHDDLAEHAARDAADRDRGAWWVRAVAQTLVTLPS